MQTAEKMNSELSCKITVCHNSPVNLIADIFGEPYSLLAYYTLVTVLVSSTVKSIKSIQEVMLNHADLKEG